MLALWEKWGDHLQRWQALYSAAAWFSGTGGIGFVVARLNPATGPGVHLCGRDWRRRCHRICDLPRRQTVIHRVAAANSRWGKCQHGSDNPRGSTRRNSPGIYTSVWDRWENPNLCD
jgi:hypothetical protein